MSQAAEAGSSAASAAGDGAAQAVDLAAEGGASASSAVRVKHPAPVYDEKGDEFDGRFFCLDFRSQLVP